MDLELMRKTQTHHQFLISVREGGRVDTHLQRILSGKRLTWEHSSGDYLYFHLMTIMFVFPFGLPVDSCLSKCQCQLQ